MKTLKFAKNFNNKLNCEYFTTIRPFDLAAEMKCGDHIECHIIDTNEKIPCKVVHGEWYELLYRVFSHYC